MASLQLHDEGERRGYHGAGAANVLIADNDLKLITVDWTPGSHDDDRGTKKYGERILRHPSLTRLYGSHSELEGRWASESVDHASVEGEVNCTVGSASRCSVNDQAPSSLLPLPSSSFFP